jgi:site-specific DNA-methyltransferase (adenine-specific)
MGMLYYGDNLDILRRYLKDGTVDLVCLDPPDGLKNGFVARLPGF